MFTRSERIAEYRRKQPLEELQRKSKKAARRGIWTQEQIDLIDVEVEELTEKIAPLLCSR